MPVAGVVNSIQIGPPCWFIGRIIGSFGTVTYLEILDYTMITFIIVSLSHSCIILVIFGAGI